MTEQTFRMKLKRLAKDLTVGVGACVKRERPAQTAGGPRDPRGAPLATIIFEFLFCASAQGEDSKEKKGCGGKEEGRKNPFVNFGTKALQALRHGSADCPWSIRCRGYGFLRGRPGFPFGRASRAAFFGSTAGLKSGYFAM